MGGTCRTDGRNEKLIQYFGRKTGKKEPLGRTRRRRKDNIAVDLKEIG
jgi:hypothetical protein